MKMDTNIRVRTDRKHQTLYKQLTNMAVGDSHELFFICACLGYQRGCSRPLGRAAEERFWSGTVTPEEWTSFYAMLLQENKMDFATVEDDKRVVARIEEYANGGIGILIEECLEDYLAPGQEAPSIDLSISKELPKALLNYVFEQGIPKGEPANEAHPAR